MRKLTLLALCGCLATMGAARAATTEADYIAARDKAVAKIKAMEDAKAKDEKINKEDEKLRNDLAKRLQEIVGAVSVKGFQARGKIWIETLSSGGIGSSLDALAFSANNEGPTLIVTTPGLMRGWLAARAQDTEVDAKYRVPADFEAAVKTDVFYTNAYAGEGGYVKAADIPVAKPEGFDHASARLGGWEQGPGPTPSDRIFVVAKKGERIYIVDADTKATTSIPACEALWEKAEKEAEKLRNDYDKGGGKNNKLVDQAIDIENKAIEKQQACFAEMAPKEKFFAAVVKEAQDYVDRLAASKP